MKNFLLMSICLLIASVGFSSSAHAQDEAPATGFALWLRMPVNSVRGSLASALATPEFAIGYRGESFGVGVGLGYLLISLTDDNSKLSGSLYQATPSGWIDFWHSEDGRTRGNLAGGFGIGKLNLTAEDSFDTDKVTATLLSFYLGLGGDHYLSRNFALGLEGGFQATFAKDIKEEGSVEDVSAAANGLYGLLRLMVVFGD